MEPVKQATAIVYFRSLRSLGRFQPIWGTQDFVYTPCTCGRSVQAQKLPNGLPEPMLRQSLGDVIYELRQELGLLCRAEYFEKRGF